MKAEKDGLLFIIEVLLLWVSKGYFNGHKNPPYVKFSCREIIILNLYV